MIKAILACDEEGGVGKEGTLPWPNNSRDFKWFKENTGGHIVVMGSKTWEDPHMPSPLPKRKNVVVTSKPEKYEGADLYITDRVLENIKEYSELNSGLITWIIGGPSLIEQTLGIIDEFYISRIPGKYDCDTFLPLTKIQTLFKLEHVEVHPEVTFEIWRKREAVS